MEKGITSVKRNGTTTIIKDLKIKTIVIFVNKTKHKVSVENLIGSEILALSGFKPQEYCLYHIKGSNKEEVKEGETVELKNGMHFHAILKEIKFG